MRGEDFLIWIITINAKGCVFYGYRWEGEKYNKFVTILGLIGMNQLFCDKQSLLKLQLKTVTIILLEGNWEHCFSTPPGTNQNHSLIASTNQHPHLMFDTL